MDGKLHFILVMEKSTIKFNRKICCSEESQEYERGTRTFSSVAVNLQLQ